MRDSETQHDPAIRALYEKVDESVDLLNRAAEIAYCNWGPQSIASSNHIGTTQSAMKLARVVGWRYNREPASPGTVIRDQLAVLALSRHVGRNGLLIDEAFRGRIVTLGTGVPVTANLRDPAIQKQRM